LSRSRAAVEETRSSGFFVDNLAFVTLISFTTKTPARQSRNQKNRNISRKDAKAAKKKK
jgi:hypothetical protein